MMGSSMMIQMMPVATADMIWGRKMMTRKRWVAGPRRLSRMANPSEIVFWKIKMKMKSRNELPAACQNLSEWAMLRKFCSQTIGPSGPRPLQS